MSREQTMSTETDGLERIVNALAVEWNMGGMDSSTIYGEFAVEVARRSALKTREATLNEILRGLKSENDSRQLQAIIASVEALRSNVELTGSALLRSPG